MTGLAACSNNKQSSMPNKHVHLSQMSQNYSVSSKATKAGNDSTLKIANISKGPVTQPAAPTLETTQEGNNMYKPGGFGIMFNQNKDYHIINGGLANLKLNRANNTATVTLRKNAKWSNGMKVTAKDVEYPYEIIANKHSKSNQFSTDMNDIKGMAAYHNGKAKKISGITFPDGPKGRKTVIHFNHLMPALKYNGNSTMWNGVEPYEYLKNVPINKLASSSKVRKHPIFVGPYKLNKQVQGNMTSWVPNKYYYGKKPQVKHIDIQVESPANIAEAMKHKKYDFAFGSPVYQYPRMKKLSDYTEVGLPKLGYNVFGFNVGKTDKNGNAVMNSHAKMANRSLRRAMMYALNLNLVAKKYGSGLTYRANTLIPPAYRDFHSSYSVNPGFPHNMNKAKQLLKNAGYKKRNGSKFVSQPNGKKLVVRYESPTGSSQDDTLDNYFVQQWRRLGIDAKFTEGKPIDQNSLIATLLRHKQTSVDVYRIYFGMNPEPTPTGFFSRQSSFNLSHFVTKKNTKLLNEMNDSASFSKAHRAKVFKEWQKYMNKEAVYVPEFYTPDWTAVSHRVKGFSMSPADNNLWSNLSLTSSKIK